MSGKTVEREHGIFDRLEDLKNEVSTRLYEINTLVKLGEETAIAETEGHKSGIEWSVVFTIIGHIHTMAEEKINEIDRLLAEQRVMEQKAESTAHLGNDDDPIIKEVIQGLGELDEEGRRNVLRFAIKTKNRSRTK